MPIRFRPFEMLKLIRDRVYTRVNDLPDVGSTRFAVQAAQFVRALHSLGWIKLARSGHITPTGRIFEIQKALGLSLTELSPHDDNSIVCNPLFGRSLRPPTSLDVFVLMPFSEDLKPVYEVHIKTVAKKLGLIALRADNFFSAGTIISEIWNAINETRILIADCTGRNPNVFYELGIAHTLGKPVILIAQCVDDIPFDIRHIRTILYEFTPRGMLDFEAAVETTLKHELAQPRSLTEWFARKRG